jgi:hypothetical protein
VNNVKLPWSISVYFIVLVTIKNMNRLFLISGIAVFVAAIFLIPSAFTPTSTQVAKASSCSASTSHLSLTGSKSGSCSSSASGSQVHQGVSIKGGSESSCTSRSDAQRPGIGFFSSQGFSSNGAMGCSSHSP